MTTKKTKTFTQDQINALKAQYAARAAQLSLQPQQLTLATSGQREPSYIPGVDYPGYNSEVK